MDNYSQRINKETLKEKRVSKVIQLFGAPSEVECISDLVYSKDFEDFKVSDPYCKLTYYTGNSFLDYVGFFPGGGTKVFVNREGFVTRIKSYMD